MNSADSPAESLPMPSSGGTFIRQPDNSLVKQEDVEVAAAAEAPAADAPAEAAAADQATDQPVKPSRKAKE